MTASIALVIGIAIGTALGFIIARRAQREASTLVEALSAKVMQEQTSRILELAETKLSGKKEAIDGTLKNMKDELTKVETLMREIGNGNVKIDTRLGEAAKVISELKDTAGGIKNALTSNSGRGQWGERMAEDVLRLSGLIEGVNYIKQRKLEAAGSKPDFTFLLPQQRKLNMDVKFPFSNYQQFVEAKTETERERFKKDFLSDVKKRVKEVQTRDYINPEDSTMDYVLLFIPNEQIFSFINEIDRELIDEAMRGRTILCSPLSLYAILAVIRQSMDSFTLESKSQQMLSIFGAFKQQWEKFKEQMETVRGRFESVHKGYEELSGARERQLDRQLERIEELRVEGGIPIATIGEAAEKATKKQIAATVSR